MPGGVTVLMIEHVMQAVMNLAQQVWVLAQGQLIARGSPASAAGRFVSMATPTPWRAAASPIAR